MIEFNCPACEAVCRVADELAGEIAECAECGMVMHVPSNVPAPAGRPDKALQQPEPDRGDPQDAPIEPPESPAAAPPAGRPDKALQQPEPDRGDPQDAPIEPPKSAAPAPPADEIPFAKKAEFGGRTLWIALGAGAIAVLIAAGLLYVLSSKPGAVAKAGKMAREARRLTESARMDRDELKLEMLDPSALVTKRDVLQAGIAKYDELLDKFGDEELKHAELRRIMKGARERRTIARVSLEMVQEVLWPGPGAVKQMFARASQSVPMVKAIDGGSGSGFLIRHARRLYVVTNRHVVAGADRGFSISFPLGDPENPRMFTFEVGPTAVELIHRGADLAAINVDTKRQLLKKHGVHPLKLAVTEHAPKITDKVWIIGHPAVKDAARGYGVNTYHPATIANIASMTEFGRCIQIGEVYPGNSGGPVLNGRGRVVGVVAFTDERGRNFAVHVDMLRSLLTERRFTVDQAEKARILTPRSTLPKEYEQVAKELLAEGFEPYDWCKRDGRRYFLLRKSGTEAFETPVSMGKTYAVLIVGAKIHKATVRVATEAEGELVRVAGDQKYDASSLTVKFVARSGNKYAVVITNPSKYRDILVVLGLFEK